MPPVENVCVGVAGIVRRGGKLLLVQRGGREEYADGYGTWGLPGGWLEHGESPFEGAVREVWEETGLATCALRDDGFVWTMSASGKRSITTLLIVCEYRDGEARNVEPQKQLAVEWVAEEFLTELDLFAPLDKWWRRPR